MKLYVYLFRSVNVCFFCVRFPVLILIPSLVFLCHAFILIQKKDCFHKVMYTPKFQKIILFFLLLWSNDFQKFLFIFCVYYY